MNQQEQNHLFNVDNLLLVREVTTRQPLGLAIDIDGTISEIAPTPDEATVTEESRKYLATLAQQLSLVVAISGRPAAEARAMIGLEGILYLGNHGLERWDKDCVKVLPGTERFKQVIAKCLGELAMQLNVQGVSVENKGISAAIHFRNAKRPDQARQAIIRAISKSGTAAGLKVTEGKMVIELRPAVEANKGIAIKALVEEYGLAGLIYAGDDLTDIDAFVALRELRESGRISTVSIAVLSGETPSEVIANADLVLCGVSEVEQFLRWLGQEIASE